jgi:hypothetical protein
MVEYNQDNIQPYQNKSFDELIDELKGAFLKASQLIPLIFDKGQQAGMQNDEIRKRIQSEFDIPGRTMRRYLPQGVKGQYKRYHNGKLAKLANLEPNQAKLADVTPVTLPPPEQPIIEPEAEFNQQVREEVAQPQPRRHEKAFLPLPLADQLNKFLLARLIGMARSNGDNGIEFKINNEGDLYLPT